MNQVKAASVLNSSWSSNIYSSSNSNSKNIIAYNQSTVGNQRSTNSDSRTSRASCHLNLDDSVVNNLLVLEEHRQQVLPAGGDGATIKAATGSVDVRTSLVESDDEGEDLLPPGMSPLSVSSRSSSHDDDDDETDDDDESAMVMPIDADVDGDVHAHSAADGADGADVHPSTGHSAIGSESSSHMPVVVPSSLSSSTSNLAAQQQQLQQQNDKENNNSNNNRDDIDEVVFVEGIQKQKNARLQRKPVSFGDDGRSRSNISTKARRHDSFASTSSNQRSARVQNIDPDLVDRMFSDDFDDHVEWMTQCHNPFDFLSMFLHQHDKLKDVEKARRRSSTGPLFESDIPPPEEEDDYDYDDDELDGEPVAPTLDMLYPFPKHCEYCGAPSIRECNRRNHPEEYCLDVSDHSDDEDGGIRGIGKITSSLRNHPIFSFAATPPRSKHQQQQQQRAQQQPPSPSKVDKTKAAKVCQRPKSFFARQRPPFVPPGTHKYNIHTDYENPRIDAHSLFKRLDKGDNHIAETPPRNGTRRANTTKSTTTTTAAATRSTSAQPTEDESGKLQNFLKIAASSVATPRAKGGSQRRLQETTGTNHDNKDGNKNSNVNNIVDGSHSNIKRDDANGKTAPPTVKRTAVTGDYDWMSRILFGSPPK